MQLLCDRPSTFEAALELGCRNFVLCSNIGDSGGNTPTVTFAARIIGILDDNGVTDAVVKVVLRPHGGTFEFERNENDHNEILREGMEFIAQGVTHFVIGYLENKMFSSVNAWLITHLTSWAEESGAKKPEFSLSLASDVLFSAESKIHQDGLCTEISNAGFSEIITTGFQMDHESIFEGDEGFVIRDMKHLLDRISRCEAAGLKVVITGHINNARRVRTALALAEGIDVMDSYSSCDAMRSKPWTEAHRHEFADSLIAQPRTADSAGSLYAPSEDSELAEIAMDPQLEAVRSPIPRLKKFPKNPRPGGFGVKVLRAPRAVDVNLTGLLSQDATRNLEKHEVKKPKEPPKKQPPIHRDISGY